MQNKDSVVLHHMGAFGGSSVRLTDIVVEDGKVIMTAEHGAKLSLLLEHCIGGLAVDVPPNGVVLSYRPCFNVHPFMGVQAQPPMGMPSGMSLASSRVEDMVGALFQHELTARLIEPLRETARKMEAAQKTQAAPSSAQYARPTGGFDQNPYTHPNSDQYWANNVGHVFTTEPSDGWNVFYPETKIEFAAAGETIIAIEVGYPTTHIVTNKTPHDVRTARLRIRATGGLTVAADDDFSTEHVDAVACWLKPWGCAPTVYRTQMACARRWVNPSFTDSAGETHVINHALIETGSDVITFYFVNDKRAQVKLENLDTGEAIPNLLVFNQDAEFTDEKFNKIYQILTKISSQAAINYLRGINGVYKNPQ